MSVEGGNELVPSGPDLQSASVDRVVAGLRALLGMAPIAGSIAAELITEIIPNQRVDRIARFVAALERRIAVLSIKNLREKARAEEFADMFAEAMRQATWASSNERLSLLASLLASGLSSDVLQAVEKRRLLDLLGELNDPEIVVLESYNGDYPGDHPFRERHRLILRRGTHDELETQEGKDREAMRRSYIENLERLCLIEPFVGMHEAIGLQPRNVQPLGKSNQYRITTLGRLLMRRAESSANLVDARNHVSPELE